MNLEGGENIKAKLQNLLQKSVKIQAYMVFPPINNPVKCMQLLTTALSGTLWWMETLFKSVRNLQYTRSVAAISKGLR